MNEEEEEQFEEIIGEAPTAQQMVDNMNAAIFLDNQEFNQQMLQHRQKLMPIEFRKETTKFETMNLIWGYIGLLVTLLGISTVIALISLVIWGIVSLVG